MQHIISALQDLWSNIQSVVGVEVLNTILAVTMILFVYFLFIRLFLTLIKSSKNVKLICDIMVVLICSLVVVGNLFPSIQIDKTDRSVITNDTLSITQNGTYDVESYASVNVDIDCPVALPSAYHLAILRQDNYSGNPFLNDVYQNGVVNFESLSIQGNYSLVCAYCDVYFNYNMYDSYSFQKLGPSDSIDLRFTSCTVTFDSSISIYSFDTLVIYFYDMSPNDIVGLSSSIFDPNTRGVDLYVSMGYYQSFVDLNLGSLFSIYPY